MVQTELMLWACECMQVPFNICEFLQLSNKICVRELDLAMCVSPSSNGSKMRSLWTNQMKS